MTPDVPRLREIRAVSFDPMTRPALALFVDGRHMATAAFHSTSTEEARADCASVAALIGPEPAQPDGAAEREGASDMEIELGCEDDPAADFQDAVIDDLRDRFLAWPLPKSVRSDLCTTMDYPHPRSGTNLLSADQAREMVAYLLESLDARAWPTLAPGEAPAAGDAVRSALAQIVHLHARDHVGPQFMKWQHAIQDAYAALVARPAAAVTEAEAFAINMESVIKRERRRAEEAVTDVMVEAFCESRFLWAGVPEAERAMHRDHARVDLTAALAARGGAK